MPEYNHQTHILIRFKLTHSVGNGEWPCICGSIQELGKWDQNMAPGLGECGCNAYQVEIAVPKGIEFEYKYLMKNHEGHAWWELGDNRKFNVKDLTPQNSNDDFVIEKLDDWVETDGTGVLRGDPWLRGVIPGLRHRWDVYNMHRDKIIEVAGSLQNFAEGYNYYGFTRGKSDGKEGIWYREWAPNAKEMSLIGEFNNWDVNATPLKRIDDFGWFEVFLPDINGQSAIPHGSLIKTTLVTKNGERLYRIPTWIKRAVQEIVPETGKPKNIFTGMYWCPPEPYEWKNVAHLTLPDPSKKEHGLKIYEAHVGMSSKEEKVNSYREFADDVLPRIKNYGYNTVQLMAIMEHAYYGSFGYHVTNFFAISSRFGTPEDLKYLIDTAHGMGLRVIMDMVHSHACKNTEDGLNMWDGSDYQYFHSGPLGNHPGWDSRLFDYGKFEVQRFLLSNLKWYITEYHFDGFRFDGVTSMLYKHHGLGGSFSSYDDYFNDTVDMDAVCYLMLANELVHELVPPAITIAEDVSGMPTLCRPVKEGGVGFDYRLAMAMPDLWIKLLKCKSDEEWTMEEIVGTLENRRYGEMTVAYTESHDQALVGDKTIAFWLMDKEMYDFMSKSSPDTPIISRGLALHKMIRSITYALGGEAYLNFMGNEFGHPEWIDFPREGNNSSYKYCRRQWNLVDNKELRYHFLSDWDVAMHQLEEKWWFMGAWDTYVSTKNEGDKVIVFEKGKLVWVFNFNSTKSFTDYRVGTPKIGKYVVELDSDDVKFGGYGRVDHNIPLISEDWKFNNRPYSMKVYTPCRTCIIYRHVDE